MFVACNYIDVEDEEPSYLCRVLFERAPVLVLYLCYVFLLSVKFSSVCSFTLCIFNINRHVNSVLRPNVGYGGG